MLNIQYSLLILSLLFILMLAVAGGEVGVAVGWCEGVKDSDVKESLLISATP